MLPVFLLTLVLSLGGAAEDESSIGDDALLLRVTRGADGAITESCQTFGVDVPYTGAPGAVQLDGGGWVELNASTMASTEGREGTGPAIVLEGRLEELSWRLTHECTAPGRITKQLEFDAARPVLLTRVALAAFTSPAVPEVVSTGLQDIAAFLREGTHGMFVSLDFPYSRITTESGWTRVSYPAAESLTPGTPYRCHTLTLGATQASGETRYGRDTGEVEAMDAYVQDRYPQRFEIPMFVSACINNRYTMPREGMVWYTYRDHPTLSFNTELMKRELDLMPQLGMQYYQVFPGVFDWVPDDPDRDTIKEMARYGNERGVRIGDYSGTSQVFCAHYNEYNNKLDHPEWLALDTNNNPAGYCFGNTAFVDHYIDTVVPAAREYGFKLHCLDFLSIAPCFAAQHGHPPGADSVYHQVKGLVRFMETLAGVDPEMMIWSNSGNWSEFLPKIAWANPNLYLTDPYIATPWPGLNMTRLLDDARREQMVSLHYSRFVPYRNFTNCQYFFSQNSIVPDIRNYQYGALSSIAVTPNLCLAEIRPWLDRLPATQQDQVKTFYATWTAFLRENFALWKSTYHIGDDPAPGNVEIYSHAAGNHGFIFLVNPNYWSKTIEVPLDARLGFHGDGPCEVREVFPVDQLLLTSEGPTPNLGSTLRMEARAQEVRVLEISPAAASVDAPRLYGIPGTLEKSADGYVLRTRGAQGTTHRFALRMAVGEPVLSSAVVRVDEPKQAKRLFAETPLRFLAQVGTFALYELTYRRTAAPSELRNWQIVPGSLAAGEALRWFEGFNGSVSCQFPAKKGPLVNFVGAYLDNAFSEDQETLIDLSVRAEEVPVSSIAFDAWSQTLPSFLPTVLSTELAWWLRTQFHLPFMYTIGAEPAFDEHTILVFPMQDPSRVHALRAWVNGVPLEVRRYAYPRNRALSTYWADLVGSGARGGDNTLVVHVEFAPD